jgi:hypothetical protein
MTLLETRNREYVLAAESDGSRFSENRLLEKLKKSKIHILIDAGAQILEMDNRGLAQEWLKICPDAPAAVFFNELQVPTVLYSNGHEVSLSTSSFVDDLGECLVYVCAPLSLGAAKFMLTHTARRSPYEGH